MAIRLGDVFIALSADRSQLDSDLNKAKGDVTGWASGLAGSAGKLLGGVVVAGATAAAGAVIGIGAAAFTAASDFDAATKKIQSQLGASDEAAKQYWETLKAVYGNNFGDSIEDVAASIATVEQAFARLGGATDLQASTEDAIALRDAFGIEVNESVEAAAELMDKFGLTSEQAFGFITTGFQKGLNSSDDFLDSITEYSTQFANGGADASQFFSLLESGLQAGALGTDKAADAFKEFRLRINDGSTLTADSLEMLGINADKFTAKLADGTLSTADAFQVVLSALNEIEDPTIRMQAAVGLIGTQFEDLGDSAVAGLSLAKFNIEDLAGATDSLNRQYENLPSFFEGLRRRALVAITPIGTAMLGVANKLTPAIEDIFSQLEDGITSFLASSNFEWNPEFKKVKLGDLFEFAQNGALGLTRIKIADFFDLSLSSRGIEKLTLGDFFDFSRTSSGGTFNIGDLTASLDWNNYIAKFSWGDYVYELSWPAFIATLGSWRDYVENLTWDQFIRDALDWANFIGKLLWDNDFAVR